MYSLTAGLVYVYLAVWGGEIRSNLIGSLSGVRGMADGGYNLMRFVVHRRDDCCGYRSERMMGDAYYGSSRFALIS